MPPTKNISIKQYLNPGHDIKLYSWSIIRYLKFFLVNKNKKELKKTLKSAVNY